MRFDTPELAAAMRATKMDRIAAHKADRREHCPHSEGCEDDCFACKFTHSEPPVVEAPPQPEHHNRCLNCQQHVLTTTGTDPLNCWKCRDLLESSDPWHRKSWS